MSTDLVTAPVRNPAAKRAAQLESFGAEIKQIYEGVVKTYRTNVEHAYKCGKLLIQAKKVFKADGRTGWEDWVEKTTGMDHRTAARWVQVAHDWGTIKGYLKTHFDTPNSIAGLLSASGVSKPNPDISKNAKGKGKRQREAAKKRANVAKTALAELKKDTEKLQATSNGEVAVGLGVPSVLQINPPDVEKPFDLKEWMNDFVGSADVFISIARQLTERPNSTTKLKEITETCEKVMGAVGGVIEMCGYAAEYNIDVS